jgi:hypothetical protein
MLPSAQSLAATQVPALAIRASSGATASFDPYYGAPPVGGSQPVPSGGVPVPVEAFDPSPQGRELQWTTLSEALALACDYYSPADPNDLFHKFGSADLTASPPVLPKVDRGRLALELSAPFVDANENGVFDTDTDARMGNGLPLALNVLDRMRVTGWGSSGAPVSGLININTATTEVMRMLPLLSPTEQPTWAAGWGAGAAAHNALSDIASTLSAYRDKIRVRPRNAGETEELDFANDNEGNDNAADTTDDNGRLIATTAAAQRVLGPASREAQGFASIGEVMRVRDLNFTSGATASYPGAHDIDRLGRDTVSIDRLGVESSRLGPNDANDDGVIDGYDEALTIANGILNNITVRSDTFAVWFVLHGYTKGDVTGLSGSDPLVPSVARRYLMIVDRSNVYDLNDKARIVLLQEVPM